jgi:hypothetical protein
MEVDQDIVILNMTLMVFPYYKINWTKKILDIDWKSRIVYEVISDW